MTSDDDPFAEPDDNERTVIRPNPGGRRKVAELPSAGPAASAPQQSASPMTAAPTDASSERSISAGLTGMNPLNAAAATLFSLISRIRNRAQHADPEAMRRSVVAEVRAFENRALQATIDPQQVKVARYAICATIDDVVLNTPWGGSSDWALKSLVGTFHRENVGGDRFYDLLARLEQTPGTNLHLLEFLYVCLSLGFEGRLRVEQGGADKHLNIRQGLARIIRGQRGETERDLSPAWMGVNKPFKAISFWKPFWISVGVLGAILGTTFVGLSYALTNSTERVLGQLSVLDPGTTATLARRAPPVAPPPPEPDDQEQIELVKEFLEAEINDGLVTVFQDARTITVRMKGKGMFASASDRLTPAFVKPLERVASALDETNGPVIVVGHSDSSPIRTARFKSNEQLSLARAEAVLKTIGSAMKQPNRLQAEGRADKEPIASNRTRDGRAANRRIEIVLLREKL